MGKFRCWSKRPNVFSETGFSRFCNLVCRTCLAGIKIGIRPDVYLVGLRLVLMKNFEIHIWNLIFHLYRRCVPGKWGYRCHSLASYSSPHHKESRLLFRFTRRLVFANKSRLAKYSKRASQLCAKLSQNHLESKREKRGVDSSHVQVGNSSRGTW